MLSLRGLTTIKQIKMKNNSETFALIAKQQDSIVMSVIGEKTLKGFEKAYIMSDAILQLRELLTPEYMQPIMALQGSKLGFRTDKDLKKLPGGGYEKGDGYPMEIVKECLIHAVFLGLQPCGNQFNIIGGNMYPTKEGLEYLLNNYQGLKYSVVSEIKQISADKSSAIVDSKIKWSLGIDLDREEIIKIPLKTDAYTSVDAIIGKSKRKACAWLLSTLTGESITDGDASDTKVGELSVSEKKAELRGKGNQTPMP